MLPQPNDERRRIADQVTPIDANQDPALDGSQHHVANGPSPRKTMEHPDGCGPVLAAEVQPSGSITQPLTEPPL